MVQMDWGTAESIAVLMRHMMLADGKVDELEMTQAQQDLDFLFMRISGESEDGVYKTYYDFDEAEYDEAERDGVTLSSTGFKYYYKKEGEVYECLISMDSRKCIDVNRYSEGQNEGNPYDQDDSWPIWNTCLWSLLPQLFVLR